MPSFGAHDPPIVIVGLAPGLHGANRTGRPFTGDHAGLLLYRTLFDAGLANQPLGSSPGDGLELINIRIVNSIKCAPPGNKPQPDEIRRCNDFLRHELAELANARVYLALGRIAHDAALMALGLPRAQYTFGHAREHALSGGQWMVDSYHCSRYNTQTRRLTEAMFREVVSRCCELAELPLPAQFRGLARAG